MNCAQDHEVATWSDFRADTAVTLV